MGFARFRGRLSVNVSGKIMSHIYMPIFLLFIIATSTEATAGDAPLSKEHIIAGIYDPLPASCTHEQIVMSNLDSTSCDKRWKESLDKCRKLIVADMPNYIKPEQIGHLMDRAMACNFRIFDGKEYSNEEIDKILIKINTKKRE